MDASLFYRTNYMAEKRNGRCLLPAMTVTESTVCYVNGSGKSKLEPCACKHDIRM